MPTSTKRFAEKEEIGFFPRSALDQVDLKLEGV
jgi:hypothetical protein